MNYFISPEDLGLPGTYHHHKGGQYVLVAVAQTHNHNGDEDVVYISLTTGDWLTRPRVRDSRNEDAWTDIVRWPDGGKRYRFVHDSAISVATLSDLAQLRKNLIWNATTKEWENRT